MTEPKKTQAEKLAEAIDWLRERNKYCLDRSANLNFYRPVHGTPLMPKGVR